jgi:hypothetical protein
MAVAGKQGYEYTGSGIYGNGSHYQVKTGEYKAE